MISFWDICDKLEWFLQNFFCRTIFTVRKHAGVKIANTVLCKTIVLHKFQLSNTVLFISDQLLYVRANNGENSPFSFRNIVICFLTIWW